LEGRLRKWHVDDEGPKPSRDLRHTHRVGGKIVGTRVGQFSKSADTRPGKDRVEAEQQHDDEYATVDALRETNRPHAAALKIDQEQDRRENERPDHRDPGRNVDRGGKGKRCGDRPHWEKQMP